MMERTSEELRAAGLTVSTDFIAGSPPRVLCDEAQRWNADYIFVGSRGFSSALERFRLGSVLTALVISAPCSVEVVRTRGQVGAAFESDPLNTSHLGPGNGWEQRRRHRPTAHDECGYSSDRIWTI